MLLQRVAWAPPCRHLRVLPFGRCGWRRRRRPRRGRGVTGSLQLGAPPVERGLMGAAHHVLILLGQDVERKYLAAHSVRECVQRRATVNDVAWPRRVAITQPETRRRGAGRAGLEANDMLLLTVD